MTKKKNIKKKVEIVFDPEKRKEFLTGFRKRKNERRKRAKEELEKNLKDERKRIRQEIKDGLTKMKKTFEPLRELTEEDKANEDEYEDDDVKVKIVELSTHDLAKQNNLLGENIPSGDSDESEEEQYVDEISSINHSTNCIPGMDFDVNARKRKRHNDDESYTVDEVQHMHKKKNVNIQPKTFGTVELKSKKDLDRLKKNKTLKELKKSKVFKMKERFDKKANQKKTKRDKNNTLKSLPKNQRTKKKFEPSRYRKGRLVNKKQLRKQQRQRS